MGGVNCKQVEKYDLGQSKWTNEAMMTASRFDFACASSESGIYVIGGKYGPEDKVTGKIEKYNGNIWRIIEIRLPFKLRGCGSLIFSQELYIFGGRIAGRQEQDNEEVITIPIETAGEIIRRKADENLKGIYSQMQIGRDEE